MPVEFTHGLFFLAIAVFIALVVMIAVRRRRLRYDPDYEEKIRRLYENHNPDKPAPKPKTKSMSIAPVCRGDGCPIKTSCARYKSVINFKKEPHLATVPYDHERKTCKFKLGTGPVDVWKQLNDIVSGKA